MSLAIYIPSMTRHSLVELRSGPLADLPVSAEVRYVVPLSECQLYLDALEQMLRPGHAVSVLGVPDGISGIAKTRLWIGRHAEAAGFSKFLMLDDDIRFLVRRSEDTWQLRGTEPHEVQELLDLVDFRLDFYGHVGISAREGNNRFGEGSKQSVFMENTRTLRALAYRTTDFLRMEHGRVEVMEDFDVNLQLLEAGIPNCNIGYWAQGQKMTNAPGGCSTYRSHEVQEASARKLQELHGADVVRLREKTNKTDADGFGTRTEVTIQWKRAFRG